MRTQKNTRAHARTHTCVLPLPGHVCLQRCVLTREAAAAAVLSHSTAVATAAAAEAKLFYSFFSVGSWNWSTSKSFMDFSQLPPSGSTRLLAARTRAFPTIYSFVLFGDVNFICEFVTVATTLVRNLTKT